MAAWLVHIKEFLVGGHAAPTIASCEDPGILPPHYFRVIFGALKFLATSYLFKIEALMTKEELTKEYMKGGLLTSLKRMGSIVAQLGFVALALKTFKADVAEAWGYSVNCMAVVLATSSNSGAAFSIVIPSLFLDSKASPESMSLLGVQKQIKTAYVIIMSVLYVLPAILLLVTHGMCGFLVMGGTIILEFAKFIFFEFWCDLFTLNWKLLGRHLYNLLIPAYAFGLVQFSVFLALFIAAQMMPASVRGGYMRAVMPEINDMMPASVQGGYDKTVPSDEPLENADSPVTPQDFTSEELDKFQKWTHFVVGVLVLPVVLEMGVIIAARVYDSANEESWYKVMMHAYGAVYTTMSERSFQKYSAHVAKTVGGLSGKLDFLWSV